MASRSAVAWFVACVVGAQEHRSIRAGRWAARTNRDAPTDRRMHSSWNVIRTPRRIAVLRNPISTTDSSILRSRPFVSSRRRSKNERNPLDLQRPAARHRGGGPPVPCMRLFDVDADEQADEATTDRFGRRLESRPLPPTGSGQDRPEAAFRRSTAAESPSGTAPHSGHGPPSRLIG